ncbi:tRNA-specific 2-thiouridylase MnmA [Novipirellula aureliae]|uniref:tRNA-specific 2-thiouridylase MnmA n=1 Tax=Novipirellula aureliae TaxID=2527966 RepID=A0A5C6E5D7_9BACT|nr:ATP-dependent sacrificial sulfur transferase LarE [Novipirellula aureliae]TWU43905.1 tRNA-specific 2-thiouridylase MnmA [Novipirellula aureliae]
MSSVSENANLLIDHLRPLGRVVIAFSGGVDSSVVAAAAALAGLDSAIAVTGHSASVPEWQIDWAKRIASQIGIDHQIVDTREGERASYVRNDSKRCFYCKQTLYQTLATLAVRYDGAVILSGTNADDLGDYRPGIEAGNLASVKTPLADLGLGKQDVRELARHFKLDNAELPASPCLASRISYGVAVTPDRLDRIERAEAWLRGQGFSDLRVRLHADELARVELLPSEQDRLRENRLAERMNQFFRSLGFQFVTVDVEGLRSGSLNQVLVGFDLTRPSTSTSTGTAR